MNPWLFALSGIKDNLDFLLAGDDFVKSEQVTRTALEAMKFLQKELTEKGI